MKNILAYLFIVAVSLSALAQAADVETVTVKPKADSDSDYRNYPISPADFYKFIRVYELSNGMELGLYRRGAIMYAKLNDRQAERIIATAPNRFQSAESKLNMRIDVQDDEVSGDVYVPLSAPNIADPDRQQFVIVARH